MNLRGMIQVRRFVGRSAEQPIVFARTQAFQRRRIRVLRQKLIALAHRKHRSGHHAGTNRCVRTPPQLHRPWGVFGRVRRVIEHIFIENV